MTLDGRRPSGVNNCRVAKSANDGSRPTVNTVVTRHVDKKVNSTVPRATEVYNRPILTFKSIMAHFGQYGVILSLVD